LSIISEHLRQVMRQWTTGVGVVISQNGHQIHGMTVNSFTSISLDPPIISVTLANETRTLNLVNQSGTFSISLLNYNQQDIADKFAGKIPDEGNRIKGLEIVNLPDGLIAIKGSLAWVECKVRLKLPFENSTLLVADVMNTSLDREGNPLIYHNRGYFSL
jgi:flavin reductase (DIM6/NTAB) family NADH-FMN oxidoreductase RutF